MAESLAHGVAKRVRINGTEMDVRARISRLQGLSGHADADQMCDWLAGSGHVPGLVVLNHGDDSARIGMETRILGAMSTSVARPVCQQTIPLS